MSVKITASTVAVVIAIGGFARRTNAEKNIPLQPLSTFEWIALGVTAALVVALFAFILWMITADD